MPTLDKDITIINQDISLLNVCILKNNEGKTPEKGLFKHLSRIEISIEDRFKEIAAMREKLKTIISPLINLGTDDQAKQQQTVYQKLIDQTRETIVNKLNILEAKLQIIQSQNQQQSAKFDTQTKSAASVIIDESVAISNSQCFSKTGVKKEMSLDVLINHAQGKTKGYSGNRTKNILLKKGILKYEGSFFNKKLVVDDDKKHEFIRNQKVIS